MSVALAPLADWAAALTFGQTPTNMVIQANWCLLAPSAQRSPACPIQR
ncbi:MAG TPA: hypothetical protein VMF07_15525 [Solirubrobacteraceae bacterium]|nr:hypothetical protein [Solirubrobacteraceae bacterium]